MQSKNEESIRIVEMNYSLPDIIVKEKKTR